MELQNLSKDQLICRISDLEAALEALKSVTKIDRAALLAAALGLTAVESRVVALLSTGRIMSIPALMDGVYFEDAINRPEDRIMSAHIHKIRKKLFPAGVVIETIHGVGFQMEKNSIIEAIMSAQDFSGMMPKASPPEVQRRDKMEKVVEFMTGIRDCRGRATASSQEIRDAVSLRGGLLPVMNRLQRDGVISIIARPTPASPRQKWIVGIKGAADE